MAVTNRSWRPSSLRLAVLASGSGTHLERLATTLEEEPAIGARIDCVIVNEPEAYAYTVAKAHGLNAHLISHRDFSERAAFEAALLTQLQQQPIDYILLLGFMRRLTPLFCRAFAGRILNIHPSLLPAFKGAHAVRDALALGVKITGATLHWVDESLDGGPIIAQEAVRIDEQECEASLHTRIKQVEYRLVEQIVRQLSAQS